MSDVVIVDAVRTPIGRFRGSLKSVRTDDLAACVIAELFKRYAFLTDELEDVIFGCVNQAGEDNRNVARMALLLAGLPVTVPGATVNRLCGSSLEAINSVFHAIKAGEGEIFIAGGVENMTRSPYVVQKAETEFPRMDAVMWDTTIGWRMPNQRLAENYPLYSMGETAENVAEMFNISRKDQDEFAYTSQMKALSAQNAGKFDKEIVPVKLALPKGAFHLFDKDEHLRSDVTLEKLASLPPAFLEGGTVTAANSSGINDGAAALLIMSSDKARELGLKPMATIVSSATVGIDPAIMGLGPVEATRKALKRAGIQIADLDLIELNEAFASQSLACIRELNMDQSKVNVNGGGIALGHPLGCSGARILTTLVHEMVRRQSTWGLATMCIGVGQGIATVVRRHDP